MLKKQTFCLKDCERTKVITLRMLGLNNQYRHVVEQRAGWLEQQIYHDDTFFLLTEDCHYNNQRIGYIKQENYIKIHFRLSGQYTVVFDGFGEYALERPQVLITSGPQEMIKVDTLQGEMHHTSVSLCVLRDFFPAYLGLELEALPEPLRAIVMPEKTQFAVHSIPLTTELATAAEAILTQTCPIYLRDLYYQSKALELMCLLIGQLERESYCSPIQKKRSIQKIERLYEARDLLCAHHSEHLTLAQISKAVGLNKTTLASGFRQYFGLTVFDYIKNERMRHAYELLQNGEHTVAQIAEAVGFNHSCNFSTAVRNHFGFSPQAIRMGLKVLP